MNQFVKQPPSSPVDQAPAPFQPDPKAARAAVGQAVNDGGDGFEQLSGVALLRRYDEFLQQSGHDPAQPASDVVRLTGHTASAPPNHQGMLNSTGVPSTLTGVELVLYYLASSGWSTFAGVVGTVGTLVGLGSRFVRRIQALVRSNELSAKAKELGKACISTRTQTENPEHLGVSSLGLVSLNAVKNKMETLSGSDTAPVVFAVGGDVNKGRVAEFLAGQGGVLVRIDGSLLAAATAAVIPYFSGGLKKQIAGIESDKVVIVLDGVDGLVQERQLAKLLDAVTKLNVSAVVATISSESRTEAERQFRPYTCAEVLQPATVEEVAYNFLSSFRINRLTFEDACAIAEVFPGVASYNFCQAVRAEVVKPEKRAEMNESPFNSIIKAILALQSGATDYVARFERRVLPNAADVAIYEAFAAKALGVPVLGFSTQSCWSGGTVFRRRISDADKSANPGERMKELVLEALSRIVASVDNAEAAVANSQGLTGRLNPVATGEAPRIGGGMKTADVDEDNQRRMAEAQRIASSLYKKLGADLAKAVRTYVTGQRSDRTDGLLIGSKFLDICEVLTERLNKAQNVFEVTPT